MAKGTNLNFRSWQGHILILLSENFGGNQSCDTGLQPKNEIPILGLNSSPSKTNRTRGIKVSNLEASGHALSALKNKP